jgi:hypothetical protein
MRKGQEVEELPWWLDPENWVYWDPLSSEFRDYTEETLKEMAVLRDFVEPNHAALKDLWRRLVARNETDMRGQGLVIGDYVTPAPALFSWRPEGTSEKRQEFAFMCLIYRALRTHERTTRIDVVGPRDIFFDTGDVVGVNRVIVPSGVDRPAFVHAMGVAAKTLATSILLYGKPRVKVVRRLTEIVTGVSLSEGQVRRLIPKDVAEYVAAAVKRNDKIRTGPI